MSKRPLRRTGDWHALADETATVLERVDVKQLAKIDSPTAFAQRIRRARESLQVATDYQEVKEVRDSAKALQAYARAREDGLAAVNAASGLVLKAEACMGRMTREVPRSEAGPGRGNKTRATVPGFSPTTADLGLDRKERQRYEQLSELDDAGVLAAYCQAATEGGQTICRASALKLKGLDEEKLAGALERLRAGEKCHVSNNSGNNEWYTPTDFIVGARRVMGAIDLDPASCEVANRTVGAERFFDEATNGLEQEWAGRVWMNPPYAQPAIGLFCEKLAASYEAGQVSAAIVLVNNGTETKWGQRLFDVASAVCFPVTRIRFIDPDGAPSGAPLQGQMIVYVGDDPEAFLYVFGNFGSVTRWTR